jgi:GT2 family glycosyltransferase
MKIAAIIVTYNRKKSMIELTNDFIQQTRKPDIILVVNNGSEDGTSEFIRERFPSVQLIELKRNIGHMGGLNIGVRTAFQQGCDAIFSVDDDARLRKDTLECLLNAVESDEKLRDTLIWSANVSPDDDRFSEPVCVKIEGEWKVYDRFIPELHDKVYETLGSANVGLFIPRSIVEHVGLPRTDLIFVGEFEFNYRVKSAGFKLYRCFPSIIYHECNKFSELKILGKTRFVSKTKPWRTYYEMRNRIYVDRIYRRRNIMKNLFITVVDSAIKMYTCENKMSTALYICRAVYDGWFGKMGMRVRIPKPEGM